MMRCWSMRSSRSIDASQRTYGAPRVHGQLRHRGRRVGRKRVARLMRQQGVVGVHGRRRWRRGKPNTAPAPDLLQRDFTAGAPDERWVADITEFKCWDGKLYLAGIKDLHDQSIVGWSMGERQTTDLVVNALVMALGRRHPDPGELTHHADRGSQYTSGVLEPDDRLEDQPVVLGATGTCFDNAAMECHLGDPETRDPTPARRLVRPHPIPAPHDPVHLHRDLLQPPTTPSPPRPPNPRRGLRGRPGSGLTHNNPCPRNRVNSTDPRQGPWLVGHECADPHRSLGERVTWHTLRRWDRPRSRGRHVHWSRCCGPCRCRTRCDRRNRVGVVRCRVGTARFVQLATVRHTPGHDRQHGRPRPSSDVDELDQLARSRSMNERIARPTGESTRFPTFGPTTLRAGSATVNVASAFGVRHVRFRHPVRR